MKNFRKILQSACSILMAFVLVFSVGCKAPEAPQAVIRPAPEAPAPTFELNKSQIDCIIGDVDKLAPNSLPDIGEATLSWRSLNPSVVTVDSDGNIEAISEGTTQIVATYGTASAMATVKVSWDDEMPQIVSPAGSESGFTIIVGQEYTFAPTVIYRGKTYDDAQLSVAVSNEGVTALDQETSTITGASIGQSNVTISGTWRGKEALRASFSVKVSQEVVLTATDGNDPYLIDQIELFTEASFGNNSDQPTSLDFVPTAQIRTAAGEEPIVKTNETDDGFTVTIADNYATFNSEENMLESVSFGDTIATISFNYEDETYVKQYHIHLERPVADFDEEAKFFSALQGTLRDDLNGYKVTTLKEFVYGDQDVNIATAFVGDQELQVTEDGAVLGITGTSASAYDVVIRIGTEIEQYNVPATVYGQYVYEATDLDVFVRTAASPELDVYVELGRDIDLANYVRPAHFNDVDTASGSTDINKEIIPNHKWSANTLLAKGFMGTFNGNGHYLMNYVQKGGHGFFEGLYGATVKNIGFVNCSSQDAALLATFTKDTTMENVYIKVNELKSSTNYWPSGVIANQYSLGGTFTNVYVDSSEANLNLVLDAGRDRYYWNVYSAMLTMPLINESQPVFENCLVISNAPVSSMGFVEHTGSQGPRFVVADNVTEAERVALRQRVWAAQVPTQQQQVMGAYTAKYNNNKAVFPNPESAEFVADPSLCLEYFYNDYLKDGVTETKRTSLIKAVEGVRAYNTLAQMTADSNIREYFNTFSSEFWTVIDGELNWGKHPANLEDGDVFLDVGILAGKPVQGIGGSNPIKNFNAGDTVEVGALSCFGYIFTGWKDAATGELLELVDGSEDKWTFIYSGKATILIAQWEVDDDAQINSGIK
ncbi:MAG: hypothetical protein J6V71_04050 [Clostridia bacterium]|nr:hypothetical protein [Clostridia bacterium]